MTKRICVMFFGLLRNLKKTLPSIRKNIFIELEKKGYQYDIYIHTWELNILNNFRTKELNIKYDNDQYKLFKHPNRVVKIENQDEVDKTLAFEKITCKVNPWPLDPTKNSMKNLVRQLYSIERVFQMATDSNKEYDAYLFLRPDMKYTSPLILPKNMPIQDNDIYVPFWASHHGTNDRMCLTSRKGASVYSSRLTSVYTENNIHSESFLKKHLLENSMIIKKLNLFAHRIRANGRAESS